MRTALRLPNLRLGFACKESWDKMVGDERVRDCAGCHRQVFNLSAMTSDEAERLLATRGLKPCVRFYRRPDGTVMTSDCPSGERREKRRLAVVASSIAASATLASPGAANAAPDEDSTIAAPADEPDKLAPAELEPEKPRDEYPEFMGEPIDEWNDHDERRSPRPTFEWSVWTRFGGGFATQPPTTVARSITPPEPSLSTATWEAALSAELTLAVAAEGRFRIGAWGEIRTSSDPIAGGELLVEGLPPHPSNSRIGGVGSIVVRAGGNAHVITTAVGFGYVGSYPRSEPWTERLDHVVGLRFIASIDRSRDDPRAWSAMFGIELEPFGALHALWDHLVEQDQY